MKIAVYAIAKDEQHNVETWLENVKDADGIFVLDTGSKDATIGLLEAGGAVVNQMHTGKTFRFDHARNEAMAYIPNDYDVCVSLDFDERLSPDWREVIETQFTDEMTTANYTLVYSHDSEGNILMSYPRLAIHRRNTCTWQYPVHEILIAHEAGQKPTLPIAAVHYGNPKPSGHYIDLLKIAYDENPKDARNVQYLAREYCGMGNFSMSIPLYQQHVDMEESAPFRAESCMRIAQMSEDFATVEWWYRHAIQHCNNIREPFCKLAQFYLKHGKYEHAIACVKSALELEKPEYDMIFEDMYYAGTWCDHMLMACYQQLGHYRFACAHRDNLLRMHLNGNIPVDIASDIVQLNQTIQEVFYDYCSSVGVQGRIAREGNGNVAETPEQG